MKVILNTDIEKLGELGDIVEVKPGYARNFLLPRELAYVVNAQNLQMMKARRKKAEQQFELEKMSAMEQKEKLDGVELSFERKSGEKDVLFGSVTTSDIEGALKEKGIDLERKKLHLEEPIKRLGNFTCKVKLLKGVEAELKIEVLPEGGERPVQAETAGEPEAIEEAKAGDQTGEEQTAVADAAAEEPESESSEETAEEEPAKVEAEPEAAVDAPEETETPVEEEAAPPAEPEPQETAEKPVPEEATPAEEEPQTPAEDVAQAESPAEDGNAEDTEAQEEETQDKETQEK